MISTPSWRLWSWTRMSRPLSHRLVRRSSWRSVKVPLPGTQRPESLHIFKSKGLDFEKTSGLLIDFFFNFLLNLNRYNIWDILFHRHFNLQLWAWNWSNPHLWSSPLFQVAVCSFQVPSQHISTSLRRVCPTLCSQWNQSLVAWWFLAFVVHFAMNARLVARLCDISHKMTTLIFTGECWGCFSLLRV